MESKKEISKRLDRCYEDLMVFRRDAQDRIRALEIAVFEKEETREEFEERLASFENNPFRHLVMSSPLYVERTDNITKLRRVLETIQEKLGLRKCTACGHALKKKGAKDVKDGG